MVQQDPGGRRAGGFRPRELHQGQRFGRRAGARGRPVRRPARDSRTPALSTTGVRLLPHRAPGTYAHSPLSWVGMSIMLPANTGWPNSGPVAMFASTAPFAASMRNSPLLLNVGTASTPPPSRVGEPITPPGRPVSQRGVPVAGSSDLTDPWNVCPPITVWFPATYRLEPSHTAAASHWPLLPAADPTGKVHTGPAASMVCRST